MKPLKATLMSLTWTTTGSSTSPVTTPDHVRASRLREADQHDEIEYLSTLITVIDYHRDPTFDTDLF